MDDDDDDDDDDDVVCRTFQKFTVSCLALYEEANLTWGEKKRHFVCMCACVCVCFKISSVFLFFF